MWRRAVLPESDADEPPVASTEAEPLKHEELLAIVEAIAEAIEQRDQALEAEED